MRKNIVGSRSHALFGEARNHHLLLPILPGMHESSLVEQVVQLAHVDLVEAHRDAEALLALVERFDIEPVSDFSAK